MPELRKDPITGTWVIVSPERKIRPYYYEKDTQAGPPEQFCPFCEGNEAMTPPEIYALRDKHTHADQPGWRLRVIPNKYPALRVEGEPDKQGEGLYDKMNGIGAHEVVVETTSHLQHIDEMEPRDIADIFIAVKRRMLDLKRDIRLKYIQFFKNHERLAGASLPHPHSQILALPVVPGRVEERLQTAKAHFEVKDRCIFCDMIRHEREFQKRVLVETGEFMVMAPFAAKLPFELVLFPTAHGAAFEDTEDAVLAAMAGVFRDVMARLNRVLQRPAYNLVLNTAPFDRDCGDYFHWFLEITPMLGGTGGFELGTASYINPTPPEEAIEILKR